MADNAEHASEQQHVHGQTEANLPTTESATGPREEVKAPTAQDLDPEDVVRGEPTEAPEFAALGTDKNADDSSENEEYLIPASAAVDSPAEASQQARADTESTIDDGESIAGSTKAPLTKIELDSAYSKTKGKVSALDGRLQVKISEAANKAAFAKSLSAGIKQLGRKSGDEDSEETDESLKKVESVPEQPDDLPVPQLNIVVMVIGSRGDIQPFIKVGKILKDRYGHRVRIATHPAFKKFVEEDCGLEFFSVGGDPSELMAFMVKNPGLIPSLETVKKGEIGKRRDAMFEMFQGFWRACVNATDDTEQNPAAKTSGGHGPFIADAIIANPPSFAHVHCAERLGCPLHMMFTFPYTPTQNFPHPLANIKSSNVDPSRTNYMSYPLVEMMTWQGLGDLANRFRVETLGLDPMSTVSAPGQLYRLKVPFSYMWSPALVPKPKDWSDEIKIAGFVFLDLASSFKPKQDLLDFLEAGEPPVYIGFGSIVVDDPKKFTQLVFDAVKLSGVRALVNEGWGGLGNKENTPDNIFMLGNTPHDWLFPRCSAVVHHGGAGTTAIGLKCAKPTMIVPFFGDQPFWGAMVAEARAGAFECIPYKKLTAEKFAEGIKQCLTDEARANVQKIADRISKEGDGAENAVKFFHNSLPLQAGTQSSTLTNNDATAQKGDAKGDSKPKKAVTDQEKEKEKKSMRCTLLPDLPAAWYLKGTRLQVSALAADVLVSSGQTSYDKLRLFRQYEWNDFQGPVTLLHGAGSALVKGFVDFGKSFSTGPVLISRDVRKRAEEERERVRQRKAEEEEMRVEADMNGRHDPEPPKTKSTDHGDSMKVDTTQRHIIEELDAHFLQEVERAENSQVVKAQSPAPSSTTFGMSKKSSSSSKKSSSDGQSSSRSEFASTVANDTLEGITAPVGPLMKLPMNVLLGMNAGLHNFPRLYGDTTVRQYPRVTGFKSGLRVAGQSAALDTWDAFTGVVTQPYQGAKDQGTKGFFKGMGKGLAGLSIKSKAAIIGVPAYAMKGVHAEFTKYRTPVYHIRRVRIAEGRAALAAMTDEESTDVRTAVLEGWQTMQRVWRDAENVKKGKKPSRTTSDAKYNVFGRAKGQYQYYKDQQALERGGISSAHDIGRVYDARQSGVDMEQAIKQVKSTDSDATVSRTVSMHKRGLSSTITSGQSTPLSETSKMDDLSRKSSEHLADTEDEEPLDEEDLAIALENMSDRPNNEDHSDDDGGRDMFEQLKRQGSEHDSRPGSIQSPVWPGYKISRQGSQPDASNLSNSALDSNVEHEKADKPQTVEALT